MGITSSDLEAIFWRLSRQVEVADHCKASLAQVVHQLALTLSVQTAGLRQLNITQRYTGPSRATAWPRKTFSWGPSRAKNLEFFFSKWCILVYFIFLSDGGAPKRCGPLPHPLDRIDVIHWVHHIQRLYSVYYQQCTYG